MAGAQTREKPKEKMIDTLVPLAGLGLLRFPEPQMPDKPRGAHPGSRPAVRADIERPILIAVGEGHGSHLCPIGPTRADRGLLPFCRRRVASERMDRPG